MEQQIILKEGVLNDDYLKVAPAGRHFKNGCRFMVIYYTFNNAWCNRENWFICRSLDAALKKYQKLCGKLSPEEIEGIYDCLCE